MNRSQVGRAKFEKNLVEYFDVFRDNGRFMLTTTDGFVCTRAYFSREASNPASRLLDRRRYQPVEK